MMKKQKMMAEGTWTNNRRGRKRKVLTPGLMSTHLQRRESGMDDTENDMSVTPSDFEADDGDDMVVDDIDVGTPGPEFPSPAVGGVQGVLDFNRGPVINNHHNHHHNNRPSPLSRSATDPAPAAPRGRGRGRGGRVASGYAPPDAPQTIAPKSFTPVNPMEDPSIKVAKRPLDANSTSPAAKRQKPISENLAFAEEESSEASVEVPFQEPTVMFTQASLASFFRNGAANAERAKKSIEQDQLSQAAAVEAATLRANRRVRETEDRLKEMSYRHRQDVRGLEDLHKDQIAALQEAQEERLRGLQADLIIARGGAPSAPVKNAPSAAPEPTNPAGQAPGQDAQLLALVDALTDLKPRYEAELVRRKTAEGRVASLEQQAATAANAGAAIDTIACFRDLDSMLRALDNHAGELSHTAVRKAISDAFMQCGILGQLLMPKQQMPASVSHFSQGPPPASPRMHGPLPTIAPTSIPTGMSPGHAPLIPSSLAPYGARRALPASASPSPAPADQGFGTPSTLHPAAMKHPEPVATHSPAQSQPQQQLQPQPQPQPRVEQKRPFMPVSISSLISQEPSPSLPATENTLAPMQYPPAQSQSSTPQPLPQVHGPPHQSPSTQPKPGQPDSSAEVGLAA